MDITKLIALNLTAWMESNPNLDTIQKLSKASHVGFGTIRRARKGEVNITVQNLDAIAQAFKKQATDLLKIPSQNFSAAESQQEYKLLSNDQNLLLQGYEAGSPDERKIMLNIAREALKKQMSLLKVS